MTSPKGMYIAWDDTRKDAYKLECRRALPFTAGESANVKEAGKTIGQAARYRSLSRVLQHRLSTGAGRRRGQPGIAFQGQEREAQCKQAGDAAHHARLVAVQ